jgi:hypothetical protein
MIPARTRAPYLALAVSAVAIAGCSDELTTGNGGPGDEITRDIGITARDEVEAALGAFTLQSTLAPMGTTQAAAAPTDVSSLACVTSSSPEDSDGDGVPDDAIYHFTAPPCRFTDWRGGTLEIVGQLRIQDPVPSAAGFGYESALTNLRTRFISSDNKELWDVTRNGTRVLSGSVSSLVLSTDVQVIRQFPGKTDAAVDQQWTVTFTPAGPLQINVPLPSGTLDIAGTIAWSRGTDNFSLTVTTPTPLHYNGACSDEQRIDGGEMHLAGTFGDMAGSVRVRWGECGREPGFSFDPVE